MLERAIRITRQEYNDDMKTIQTKLLLGMLIDRSTREFTMRDHRLMLCVKNAMVNIISTALFETSYMEEIIEDPRMFSILSDFHSKRSDIPFPSKENNKECRKILMDCLVAIAYRRAGLMKTDVDKWSERGQLVAFVYVMQGVRVWVKVHFKTKLKSFETKVELEGMIRQYRKIGEETDYGPMEGWDVHQLTDMSSIFLNKSSYINKRIGAWDVSNVKNMYRMFENSPFNSPIGGWDVRKVENTSSMFCGAMDFNQLIGGWNVGKVKTMQSMFDGASSFNQPIGAWDVSNVENMSHMFENSNFNSPIGDWDVRKVENTSSMFCGAMDFNQPIGGWNVGKVQTMKRMFDGASSFNQPIAKWDVREVYNMYAMFDGATKFNQRIGNWKVHENVDIQYMFAAATSFRHWPGEWTTRTSRFFGIHDILSDFR